MHPENIVRVVRICPVGSSTITHRNLFIQVYFLYTVLCVYLILLEWKAGNQSTKEIVKFMENSRTIHRDGEGKFVAQNVKRNS
jgi:hypothetical protein